MKMKNKKAQEYADFKIVGVILVIMVVATGIWAVYRYGGLDILKNVFPTFGVEQINYTSSCNVKIAVVDKDGFIGFCKDNICNSKSFVSSPIKIDGQKIMVYQASANVANPSPFMTYQSNAPLVNEQIGRIISSSISIYPGMLTKKDQNYPKVSAAISSIEDYLPSLNNAKFYDSKTICRDKKA
jgi:hypothetical protein